MYGAVPLAPIKTISGAVASLHTAILPPIVAVGKGFTVIVALPLCGCEQVVELASCTLNKLYTNIPTVDVGADTTILFPLIVVAVRRGPLLIVYVKVKGGVPTDPVKVIFGAAPPLQTSVVPPIKADANGNGFTIIVTLAL